MNFWTWPSAAGAGKVQMKMQAASLTLPDGRWCKSLIE